MNEIQDKKAFILEILRKYDSPYFQRKLEGEEESNKVFNNNNNLLKESTETTKQNHDNNNKIKQNNNKSNKNKIPPINKGVKKYKDRLKKNAQMRSKLLISEREALKNKKLNEEETEMENLKKNLKYFTF